MDSRYNQQHPLPAPPGPPGTFDQGSAQQQYHNPTVPQRAPVYQAQNRKSRGLSFRSEKSVRSTGSNNKVESQETSAEKESKRLHSKADPRLAMNEAEPSAVAAGVKSQLAPLREMQHKDAFGNPIAEPDLSNPTRSRWERPLDTIRSFEAAIDDSDSVSNINRRSSYYANPNSGRFPARDSYYSTSRPQSMFRAESSHFDLRPGGMGGMGGMGQRDSSYEQQIGYGNGYNVGPPPVPAHARRGYPRMGSEPQVNYRQEPPNVYPIPNNHRSYETVASASGSGTSGEPAGYQTDPTSSDNSSIDHLQATMKRQHESSDHVFGSNPGQGRQSPAGVRNVNGNERQPAPSSRLNNFEIPPSVPQKGGSTLKKPSAPPMNSQPQRPAEPEKHKSWLSRRFSKRS